MPYVLNLRNNLDIPCCSSLKTVFGKLWKSLHFVVGQQVFLPDGSSKAVHCFKFLHLWIIDPAESPESFKYYK